MTRQATDTLYYEDNEYHLNHYILELYFRKNPDLRPENSFVSSAMWRGYVAHFEIRNNQLFALNREYNFQDLFPKNGKMEWYSGLIRIDDYRGEFDSEDDRNGIFEYLEILRGNFIKKRIFNFEELQIFKKQQYEYFLISDEIHDIYDFWRKNNENGLINIENANKIIAEKIMEHTTEVYVD